MAEGMQYACLQGGKRIRPQLLFMTLSLLGKERDLGFPFAAALEMIHSYSLVHDDLPAMDNDDYRRGQLTTHKKFGEANGILIGDALLTNAFSVMIRGSMGKVAAEKILEIVALFSEYAGIDGMIGGQAMDVAYAGKQISYKTLTFIHEHKTGRLLLLPILVACILGDASLEQREALESYGKKIGLAFQIKDDILDVEGSFEELGKAVKSDEKLANMVGGTLRNAMAKWRETIVSNTETQTTETESQTQETQTTETKKQEETQKTEETQTTESTEKKEDTQKSDSKKSTGTVKTKDICNVRKSPSTDGELLGKVDIGVELKKLGTEGDWTKVKFQGGTGYVKSEFVKEVSSKSGSGKGTVKTKDICNVRKTASTDGELLGKVDAGVKLKKLGTKGEWTKVKFQGKTGYIKSDLLKTVK